MRKSFTTMSYTHLCAGLLILISVFYSAKTANQEIRKNTLKEITATISEYNYINSKIESVSYNVESKFVINFSSLKRIKTKLIISEQPGKSKFYSAFLFSKSKYSDLIYADLSYLKFLRITKMLC